VLEIVDTKEEAAYEELLLSWKHSIPTATFRASKSHVLGQDGLDRFWKKIGDNYAKAADLLCQVGRHIDYPLWSTDSGNLLIRRPMVTAAVNVEIGMEVMLEDKVTNSKGKRIPKTCWSKITWIEHDHYEGTVYSLEVDGAHTYFADGILTHNCWRGAVDALKKVEADPYYITQSFRFGPQIAGVANTILNTFFGEERPLVGLGPEGSITRNRPEPPYTYLSRTNAFLFAHACGLAGKHKLYTPGGQNGSLALFDSVMNVYHLWKGDKYSIRDPELKFFEDYWEFSDFVKTGNADAEYTVSAAIVDKYKEDVPAQIEKVKASLVSTPQQAEITLITAHRAKGLEWDNVILCEDFRPLYDEETGNLRPIGHNPKTQIAADEINLLYVASTRAKSCLVPNRELARLLGVA
jgi:hypothetical protein